MLYQNRSLEDQMNSMTSEGAVIDVFESQAIHTILAFTSRRTALVPVLIQTLWGAAVYFLVPGVLH